MVDPRRQPPEPDDTEAERALQEWADRQGEEDLEIGLEEGDEIPF